MQIPISKIEDARAKDKDTNLCRLVYDDSVATKGSKNAKLKLVERGTSYT